MAQLVSLGHDFTAWRSVAGDGNCFYRSALFGVLEHVLVAPDPALGNRCVVGAHARAHGQAERGGAWHVSHPRLHALRHGTHGGRS